MNKKIAIIGVGNMGSAIASSLLQTGTTKAATLILSDTSNNTLCEFVQQGVRVTKDSKEVSAQSDILILAVKPQDMHHVLESIASSITQEKLIISIAAGYSIRSIEQIIGSDKKIIRVMPNLAARVGKSISGWIGNARVQLQDKETITMILQSIGASYEVNSEEDINKVTAISGSGTGYILYFCEQIIASGIHMGLSQEISELLVKETLIGCAKLIETTDATIKELRAQVTSKGGTTQTALDSFQKEGFERIVQTALFKALIRAKELEQ